MSAQALDLHAWQRVRELLERQLGLQYPPERLPELKRGLAATAREIGLPGADALARTLCAGGLAPQQVPLLARHLTIGETYFFRDPALMTALRREILPALIRERRGRDQRLRLWSAGCASGEEPYTLAILLHELLPDLSDWQVTLLGTDINPAALAKAQAASYGEWSFRDVPPALRAQHFEARGRLHVLKPALRALVKFGELNLVQDSWPASHPGQQAWDLVICRNVLMYFGQAQSHRVLSRLQDALAEGGWMALGPCEASGVVMPRLRTLNVCGAQVHHKTRAAGPGLPPVPAAPRTTIWPAALRRRPPHPPHPPKPAAPAVPPPRDLRRQAQALADAGRLQEALAACDDWIRADKLDAAAHCLHGIILIEQQALGAARSSLERALFLDPALALGHQALGDLARREGDSAAGERHLEHARRLLAATDTP